LYNWSEYPLSGTTFFSIEMTNIASTQILVQQAWEVDKAKCKEVCKLRMAAKEFVSHDTGLQSDPGPFLNALSRTTAIIQFGWKIRYDHKREHCGFLPSKVVTLSLIAVTMYV
jgi:hypothetical protein